LVEPANRANVLRKAADILQARRFHLAAWQILESGKTWIEADADVSEAIDFCNFYSVEMLRISENPRRRDVAGESNTYFYEPRGVVGVIHTFSFPLSLFCGVISAAVVTGNAVVAKPALRGSAVAHQLLDIFHEAGLPQGVIQLVTGRGAIVGDAIVRHPGVAMVSFTGSRKVGEQVYAAAAQIHTRRPGFKHVILDLGGKNAVIVDSDADLDEAIRGVMAGAFAYSGQKCTATSRVIVVNGAYERFASRLIEAVRHMSIGPAELPTTSIPPLIDRDAVEQARSFIDRGRREAKLAFEGDAAEVTARTGGYFVAPAVFVDVPPDASIAREEVLAPVLCIQRAADFDDAIQIFNAGDYGLTGGVYSRSPENIEKARRLCDCGNFYINRKITNSRVDLQPFGGTKMSGLGAKIGGPDYLIQFCQTRTISENTLRRGFAPAD
jgi:RHH-type proline utilization regulon transcriptional repressor/proline dehydrogenase/delta 1-pyrroline-5-carboxylate dehydrogenase